MMSRCYTHEKFGTHLLLLICMKIVKERVLMPMRKHFCRTPFKSWNKVYHVIL